MHHMSIGIVVDLFMVASEGRLYLLMYLFTCGMCGMCGICVYVLYRSSICMMIFYVSTFALWHFFALFVFALEFVFMLDHDVPFEFAFCSSCFHICYWLRYDARHTSSNGTVECSDLLPAASIDRPYGITYKCIPFISSS